MDKLLSRDDFRNGVFARDKHKCLMCDSPARDAHHILERRLFPDGGYYLDNGASLCEEHHLEAEMTTLSCEEIREKAGIERIILPPHLYRDQRYDKWGNPFLENGQRLRGELFDDPSVQKILEQGNVLDQFTKYVKYPRTYHLPWSPGLTKDDRVLDDTSIFFDQEVVVTVKMDGENTTLYNDYIHARSVDSEYTAQWRTRIKQIWSEICWQIPDRWRICAENLQGKHSIKYEDLPSFLMAFSIWDEQNFCLSWDDTKEYCAVLDLEMVPELYRGIYDEDLIKSLYKDEKNCEGYVVRLAGKFHYKDFRKSCGKFVRKDHVATSRHWKYEKIEFNELKSKS